VHFAEWPWHRRGVLRLLTAAEGLPERALGWYNLILLAWSATAITAVVCETRRGERLAAVAGLATFWPARTLARHHYRWLETTRRQVGLVATSRQYRGRRWCGDGAGSLVLVKAFGRAARERLAPSVQDLSGALIAITAPCGSWIAALRAVVVSTGETTRAAPSV
jgi:hypothetical protein